MRLSHRFLAGSRVRKGEVLQVFIGVWYSSPFRGDSDGIAH